MKPDGEIDLRSDNSVVTLSADEDRVMYRKRSANDAALVLESLAPYREAITGLMLAGLRHDGRGLSGAPDQHHQALAGGGGSLAEREAQKRPAAL